MKRISVCNRLFKNRSFLVGIISLFFPIALVLTSFFVNMDAITVRAWVKYFPPMSSIPYVLSENNFKENAVINPFWQIAKDSIKFEVLPKQSCEYLVTMKNGVITKIWDSNSGQKIEEINLENCEQLLKNGTKFELKNIKLKIGENINISDKNIVLNNDVMRFISTNYADEINYYEVCVKDNRAEKIYLNKKPISEINLDGKKIDKTLIDGKEKRIYFPLGSDAMGRDLLARIAYGGRISLMVGIVSTFVSLIIGVCYGAISGYFGGKIDSVMMAWVNVLYAIPFMFLVILLLVYIGNNVFVLFAALGAVQWLTMSRIVRTSVMNIKNEPYILAAKMSGCNHQQILRRHILPNIAAPIIIYTTLTVPAVILEESFLSFIGLSVQFNGMSLDSWGTLISQGVASIGGAGENFWLLIFPSFTMVLALLGFNFMGDGLREVLDPKSH